MEKRDLWCVPLKIYTDEVFNISYVKILGEGCFESIKIPTTLEKFKSRHILNPSHLLHVEMIKTRKNWILKNVLEHRQIMQLDTYPDFLKQAQLITVLLKHLYDDQETRLLPWLVEYFEGRAFGEVEIVKFESELMQQLGFR